MAHVTTGTKLNIKSTKRGPHVKGVVLSLERDQLGIVSSQSPTHLAVKCIDQTGWIGDRTVLQRSVSARLLFNVTRRSSDKMFLYFFLFFLRKKNCTKMKRYSPSLIAARKYVNNFYSTITFNYTTDFKEKIVLFLKNISFNKRQFIIVLWIKRCSEFYNLNNLCIFAYDACFVHFCSLKFLVNV